MLWYLYYLSYKNATYREETLEFLMFGKFFFLFLFYFIFIWEAMERKAYLTMKRLIILYSVNYIQFIFFLFKIPFWVSFISTQQLFIYSFCLCSIISWFDHASSITNKMKKKHFVLSKVLSDGHWFVFRKCASSSKFHRNFRTKKPLWCFVWII